MIFSEKQVSIAEKITLELDRYFSQISPSDSAIAYSGGLDSTILLAFSGFRLKPYNLSSRDSRDFENASNASGLLNFSLNHIDLDEIDMKSYVEIVKEIDPDINNSELGYELVLTILFDRIPEKNVYTGQGADELFFGYRRFQDDPGLDNAGHMNKLFTVTLPRELKIADYFGKTLKAPYLESDIARLVASIPREDHFAGETNKAILRAVASLKGLPSEIISLKKKAAQYGSGINKKIQF